MGALPLFREYIFPVILITRLLNERVTRNYSLPLGIYQLCFSNTSQEFIYKISWYLNEKIYRNIPQLHNFISSD